MGKQLRRLFEEAEETFAYLMSSFVALALERNAADAPPRTRRIALARAF